MINHKCRNNKSLKEGEKKLRIINIRYIYDVITYLSSLSCNFSFAKKWLSFRISLIAPWNRKYRVNMVFLLEFMIAGIISLVCRNANRRVKGKIFYHEKLHLHHEIRFTKTDRFLSKRHSWRKFIMLKTRHEENIKKKLIITN